MELADMIKTAQADLAETEAQMRVLGTSRAGLAAELKHMWTMERSTATRRPEQLTDSILRVVAADGSDLGHKEIIRLLRNDGVPVPSEPSVKTIVSRLAESGQLVRVKRGSSGRFSHLMKSCTSSGRGRCCAEEAWT